MKYKVLREHIGDKFYKTGDIREVEERDVAHLVRSGVLHLDDGTSDALLEDGPTVAEFVAAGYRASNYPPKGYASRSTPEEIAESIAAQEQTLATLTIPVADVVTAPAIGPQPDTKADGEQQKAETAPANKAEKAPKNKGE